MRITPEGRHISVRGREVRMTTADVVTFLKAVAAAFPEVQIFDFSGNNLEPAPPCEISVDDPALPDRRLGKVALLFVGPNWELDASPKSPFRVRNFPRLNATIRAAEFWPLAIKEIGRKVIQCHMGLLNANHYADDKGGKRLIDKLFRVHRKLVDNKVVPVDLRTGEVIGEVETSYYWHGADMARQCLDKPDHYLNVSLDREKDRFWSYKPVKIPGE